LFRAAFLRNFWVLKVIIAIIVPAYNILFLPDLVADGNQFMPPFALAHCLNIRQQFAPTGHDFIADGNIEQRANHIRRRRRDLPQTPTLPKFTEAHEFGSPKIFMDPSFFRKATEPSSTEERTPLKPPKFLVDSTNRRPDHRSVSILSPVSDSVSSFGDHFLCFFFAVMCFSSANLFCLMFHFDADFGSTAFLCCYCRLAYLFNMEISLLLAWEKLINVQATTIASKYGQLVLHLTGMIELLVHCLSVRSPMEAILGLCLR
jgi:hypothetical protein